MSIKTNQRPGWRQLHWSGRALVLMMTLVNIIAIIGIVFLFFVSPWTPDILLVYISSPFVVVFGIMVTIYLHQQAQWIASSRERKEEHRL